MRLDKLTIKAQEALRAAQELASPRGHQELTPEHLLLALLDQKRRRDRRAAAQAGRRSGAGRASQGRRRSNEQTQVRGATAEVYVGRRLQDLLEEADARSRSEFKDEYVSSEHLLLALADARTSAPPPRALKDAGVDHDALLKALAEVRGTQRVTDQNAEGQVPGARRSTPATSPSWRARASSIPVIGRDEEIRRAMQVLSRRTKNNPVLIGEPGVGKTAIVEGIAQRIAARRRARVAQGQAHPRRSISARSSPAPSTAASSRIA